MIDSALAVQNRRTMYVVIDTTYPVNGPQVHRSSISSMPEHLVKYTLPQLELGRADIKFEVFIDAEKVGELRASQGGLDWWPKGAKTTMMSKTWSQLRSFMEA